MKPSRDKSSVLEPSRGLTEAASADDVHDVRSTDLQELLKRPPGRGQVATAVVADLSADGLAKVIVSGDTEACEAASLLHFRSKKAASEVLLGRTVLVLLNSQTRPVILGVVEERLWDDEDAESASEQQVKLSAGQPMSVQVDKRRVDLEASDEIRLTCGKSSLVMRRDGTVIVRGVQIVSRATQSNKIRGATVNIN
jgi:hypothetical protein